MLQTNTTQTVVEAVRSGVGCAVLPCVIGEHDPALRRPRPMQPMPLWSIYHEELRRSLRLRKTIIFIDAVIEANSGFLVPEGFPFDA